MLGASSKKARIRCMPKAVEQLEDRLTPSGFGAIGALGDSITDEYQFYPPDRSQAQNRVEILAANRRADFGAFTTKNRGVPRHQGFADNWAESDSTSTDLVANQLPGLRKQVAAGKIKYAWILTGGNDYLFYLRDQVTNPSPAAIEQLAQVQANLIGNFETAVNTLLAASPKVKLVVATVPDLGIFPTAKQDEALFPQVTPLVGALSQAIFQYDDVVRAVAAANPSRIALVDLQAQTGFLYSDAQADGGTLNIAGTTINFNTASDDYHSFFLADGLHPGTGASGHRLRLHRRDRRRFQCACRAHHDRASSSHRASRSSEIRQITATERLWLSARGARPKSASI